MLYILKQEKNYQYIAYVANLTLALGWLHVTYVAIGFTRHVWKFQTVYLSSRKMHGIATIVVKTTNYECEHLNEFVFLVEKNYELVLLLVNNYEIVLLVVNKKSVAMLQWSDVTNELTK